MTTLDLATVTETFKRDLHTAVISDTLNPLGYRDQVMKGNINPVTEHVVLVGRLAVDYDEPLSNPYGSELKFIDTLVPCDVVGAGTNMSVQNGLWGDLLSAASKYRGARGTIIDGYVRDVRRIRELGFPTWATSTRPVDSAGRALIIAYDISVPCGVPS